MKNNIRKIIDILMTIFFILLMGYHIIDGENHEILGVVTFILFIIHNILNIKWYKTIFKGKVSFYKVLQVTNNLLLFIAMLGMMISGIMISAHVFSFLGIETTMFGRSLHMLSTSWGFVLMSIHVGFHLKTILFKLNKKMKDSMFEYIYYFIIFILMIFGCYTFITSGLWKDLFLVSHFKFFDYNQSPYYFYFGQLAILILFSFITYFIIKMRDKLQKKVR